MADNFKKYVEVKNNIIIVGFGCLGQAVLPLLFRHLQIKSSQIHILTEGEESIQVAHEYGVKLTSIKITKENYNAVMDAYLHEGDFLLNLSVGVSSIDLIALCREKGALYLDTCTEPWAGIYTNKSLPSSFRSNYAMREEAIQCKDQKGPTAVLTHGANPGLVSHFMKQALCNLAKDNGYTDIAPQTGAEWASLAKRLGIKSIHIAECDTQTTNRAKMLGEFVNTWSTDGLMSEGAQPAELGWGTHERHWPKDGSQHTFGSKCAIYLERPGATTKVRTWTPLSGAVHGFLITHAESISISNYLTSKENNQVDYRPTVHFAYVPCPDAILSLNELIGKDWCHDSSQRLLLHEIVGGIDALGVLLMGNEKGAYWYGSQLSIQEARQLAPHNNATSMQVVAGVLSGLVWAMQHPNEGLIEPEDMDYQFVLDIASPYLGSVGGHYTDWTPLKNRESLFTEQLDYDDPWQFLNIRVI